MCTHFLYFAKRARLEKTTLEFKTSQLVVCEVVGIENLTMRSYMVEQYVQVTIPTMLIIQPLLFEEYSKYQNVNASF